jgi:uncharacterized lipoprotein YmbA
MTRFALSFLVLLGLVGCSTVRPTSMYEVDLAKVAAIERAATTQGVQVYWVNKPVKLAAAGS